MVEVVVKREYFTCLVYDGSQLITRGFISRYDFFLAAFGGEA